MTCRPILCCHVRSELPVGGSKCQDDGPLLNEMIRFFKLLNSNYKVYSHYCHLNNIAISTEVSLSWFLRLFQIRFLGSYIPYMHLKAWVKVRGTKDRRKCTLAPCISSHNDPPTQKQGALLENLCTGFLFFLCAALQHWQNPTIAALTDEQERGKAHFTWHSVDLWQWLWGIERHKHWNLSLLLYYCYYWLVLKKNHLFRTPVVGMFTQKPLRNHIKLHL